MASTCTWSRSVGMKEIALQVAATLMRLQNTVYLTGVFSSMPWNRLLSLQHQNKGEMVRFIFFWTHAFNFLSWSVFLLTFLLSIKSESRLTSKDKVGFHTLGPWMWSEVKKWPRSQHCCEQKVEKVKHSQLHPEGGSLSFSELHQFLT